MNESGHSRFPAVDGDLDNVLGLIHARDLLKLITKPDLDVKTPCVPRASFREPADERAPARLQGDAHRTWRLVIDESGASPGLITIEDVLEQIVGDISDEFDREDKSEHRPRREGLAREGDHAH